MTGSKVTAVLLVFWCFVHSNKKRLQTLILALLSAHAERFSVSCMRDFLFASLWTFVFLFLHNKCSVEIVCQCFKTYIILKKSIDKIKKGRAMTMAFLYAIAVGKIRPANNVHQRY